MKSVNVRIVKEKVDDWNQYFFIRIYYYKKMRFYRQTYPEVDDIVMVKITEHNPEFGYYGDLLEYPNLKGFLSLSELHSGKYIVKKNQLRVGETIPLSTLSVDKTTNTIDLSKKKIRNENIDEIIAKYRKLCSCLLYTSPSPRD